MTRVLKGANALFMRLLAILFLSPVVLMVLTSIKPEAEVLNPESLIPKHWTLSNYSHILSWSEEAPFGRWLFNSVFISGSATLLVVVFSSMAAYAITRLKAPGGNLFLGVVVATMITSIWLTSISAWRIARSAAASARSDVVSSSRAMCRRLMPVRSTIQSSLVSTIFARS